MLRNYSISCRMASLITVMILCLVFAVLSFSYYFCKLNDASLSEACAVMNKGYERTLQYSVESMATKLGDAVSKDKEAGDKVEIIIQNEIKKVRFGDDGYYFAYDIEGHSVAHPLKPEFQGQMRIDTRDKRGTPYIQQLIAKAKEGGGFVVYWFPKPGEQEPSPKLAFAKMVPGTNVWVSTGIYIDDIEGEKQRISKQLDSIFNTAITTIFTGIAIFLLVIVLPFSFYLVRSIIYPLRHVTEGAQKMASGHTDIVFEELGRDEMTSLEKALNVMMRNLFQNMEKIEAKSKEAERQTEVATSALQEAEHASRQAEQARERILHAAGELRQVVEAVSSASEELSTQIEQSSRGAESQSSRVNETAAAMDEMNATVLEVARNASSAAGSADQARDRAREGASIVSRMVACVESAREKSRTVTTDMAALGQRAESIGQIMNVISDIADQTNLLALNAAIEAARAGEAGRGFAVVADEVRKLAEKTMTATKEVGEAIRGIQDGTRVNVENVAQTVKTIEDATTLAVTSGEVLDAIVALVECASDQVGSIATSAQQQSSASEQIHRSVEEINTISSETSQAMTQAATAVHDLARQSHTLRSLMGALEG